MIIVRKIASIRKADYGIIGFALGLKGPEDLVSDRHLYSCRNWCCDIIKVEPLPIFVQKYSNAFDIRLQPTA